MATADHVDVSAVVDVEHEHGPSLVANNLRPSWRPGASAARPHRRSGAGRNRHGAFSYAWQALGGLASFAGP